MQFVNNMFFNINVGLTISGYILNKIILELKEKSYIPLKKESLNMIKNVR